MRRLLFIAILAVLMSDASGVSALLVPEECPIATTESAPDSGCPVFCVRCTCACCATSIESSSFVDVTVYPLPPASVGPPAVIALPVGPVADILHVPRALLT